MSLDEQRLDPNAENRAKVLQSVRHRKRDRAQSENKSLLHIQKNARIPK